MSILIKGMEMPKDGEMLCINIYPSGKVCINQDLKCKRVATAENIPCWVSVSDRLPEDGEDVLCRLLDDNCEVCATVGCYSSTFKLWDLDAEWASSRHVTHWMPLPALS